MLVLARKVGQTVEIDGGRIVIRVEEIRGKSRVRIAIDAPEGMTILRGELASKLKDQQQTPGTGEE